MEMDTSSGIRANESEQKRTVVRSPSIDPSASAAEDRFRRIAPRLEENDFECGLCLSLLCEPVTIPCGHSFCQTCLTSALEQSKKQCPTCRAVCNVDPENMQISLTIANVAQKLFPEEYRKRKEQVELERRDWGNRLSIFYMGTHFLPFRVQRLRLFEPRYVLMVQRALKGDMNFGYVNGYADHDGVMGVQLHIEKCEWAPDGGAVVECTAPRRFRVSRVWTEQGTHGLDRAQVEYVTDELPPYADSTPSDAKIKFIKEFQIALAEAKPWVDQFSEFSYHAHDFIADHGTLPEFSSNNPVQSAEKISFYIANLLGHSLSPEARSSTLHSRNSLERMNVCTEALKNAVQILRAQVHRCPFFTNRVTEISSS